MVLAHCLIQIFTLWSLLLDKEGSFILFNFGLYYIFLCAPEQFWHCKHDCHINILLINRSFIKIH